MWGSLISVKIPFWIEPLKCNFYRFLYDFIKKRILKGLVFNFRSKRRYLEDIRRIRAKTRQNGQIMENGEFSILHYLQHGHAEGSAEGQKVTRKQKNDVAVLHGHPARPCRRPC